MPVYSRTVHVLFAEDWIVVLDSDMVLRRPFLPADFNLSRGWAVGAKYDYMIGGEGRLRRPLRSLASRSA